MLHILNNNTKKNCRIGEFAAYRATNGGWKIDRITFDLSTAQNMKTCMSILLTF